MRRRLGDRSDGYRLRKIDPFFRVIPFIMKKRSASEIFFEERIYIAKGQKFIRELRNEGYRCGFLHIIIASMVRMYSQKPKVNRSIRGKKHYARNEISIAFAIKKEMSEKAEETTVKVKFKADANIYEVIDEVNRVIDLNKQQEQKNNTDKFVIFFKYLPNFVLAGAMGLIRFFDNLGILPRFLIDLSPFHASMFITDVGSIGIKPVYHHLYNLGTVTSFVAFGTRAREQYVDAELNVENKKALDVRIVSDERVVDGYYFAGAIKLASRILSDPSCLRERPEQIVVDDEI